MAIFNSYVGLPEGIYLSWSPLEELRLPQTWIFAGSGDLRNFRNDLFWGSPRRFNHVFVWIF